MKRQLSNPALVVVLAAVLAALAALQYRWIGEISSAERERLERGLASSARMFRGELNRRLLRLAEAFWLDPRAATSVEDRLARRWQAYQSSPDSLIGLEAVYVVRPEDAGGPAVQRLRPGLSGFEPAELPPSVASLLTPDRRQRRGAPGGAGFPRPGAWMLYLSARTLAAPLVRIEAFDDRQRPRFEPVGAVYLILDEERLTNELFPALVERYFGESTESAEVSIVERTRDRTTARVAFRSGPQVGESVRPVIELPLVWDREESGRVLSERMRSRFAGRGQRPPDAGPREKGRGRRPPDAAGGPPGAGALESAAGFATVAPGPGAPWILTVTLAEGSLDAVVARTRRRNLLVSFGVLLLLAAGMGLVVTSARRAERLAAMQMEFVAGVSHELRTPLAVIRSAGENLAEGVVSSPEQIKEYGALVRDEGRRLSEMVEETLEFAGSQAGPRRAEVRTLSPEELLRPIVEECKEEAEREGSDVAIEIPPGLPEVRADEAAVRLCLRNLLQNAGRYGGGSRVTVSVESGAAGVDVKVTDRGPGIPRDDVGKIFEPFYRGRHAADHHVRGSGLGLSLAKTAAESFGGSLSVVSRPNEETTFTLRLPRAEQS